MAKEEDTLGWDCFLTYPTEGNWYGGTGLGGAVYPGMGVEGSIEIVGVTQQDKEDPFLLPQGLGSLNLFPSSSTSP